MTKISPDALTILRQAAGPDGLTAEGEKWITGDVCVELHELDLCRVETVRNPDGSKGGGAYYLILPKGRAYLKALP